MSKTIPCRFDFVDGKESNWSARVFADDNGAQLWGHRHLPQNQGNGGRKTHEEDKRGTKAAKRNLAAAISPRYFKSYSRWKDAPKSFEDFKQQAIESFFDVCNGYQ
jgi:hypothetical protein